jgi:hypothetical protein
MGAIDIAAEFVLVAFLIGFLPAIIARRRRHNSAMAIFIGTMLLEIGNFLVATTIVAVVFLWIPIFTIAWAVLLVWSTTSNTRPREIVVEQSRETPQERWRRMHSQETT